MHYLGTWTLRVIERTNHADKGHDPSEGMFLSVPGKRIIMVTVVYHCASLYNGIHPPIQ